MPMETRRRSRERGAREGSPFVSESPSRHSGTGETPPPYGWREDLLEPSRASPGVGHVEEEIDDLEGVLDEATEATTRRRRPGYPPQVGERAPRRDSLRRAGLRDDDEEEEADDRDGDVLDRALDRFKKWLAENPVTGAMMAVAFVLLFLYLRLVPTPPKTSVMRHYREGVTGVLSGFSRATHMNETLDTVGRQWILRQQPAPLVLVVAATRPGRLVDGLTKVLATTPDRATSAWPVIDVKESTSRAELHPRLERLLESGVKRRFVVLTGLEKMSWDTPLALHAFADHESYPVANALLVLSVTLEEEPDLSRLCDDVIEDYLREKWKTRGGKVDQISPIFARILGYSICF